MQRIDGWWSLISSVVLITGLIIPAAPARAQGPVPRVFVDCQGPQCDSNYYRTEITWVTWVRDQQDAHVHVIMTGQTTGAGGREFLLDFMGRGEYQDYEARSLYRALPTDTQREVLDGVTLTLGLGLAMFATESGFRDIVQLEGTAPVGGALIVSADQVDDPWNLWVLRVNASGNYSGEYDHQDLFGEHARPRCECRCLVFEGE